MYVDSSFIHVTEPFYQPLSLRALTFICLTLTSHLSHTLALSPTYFNPVSYTCTYLLFTYNRLLLIFPSLFRLILPVYFVLFNISIKTMNQYFLPIYIIFIISLISILPVLLIYLCLSTTHAQ